MRSRGERKIRLVVIAAVIVCFATGGLYLSPESFAGQVAGSKENHGDVIFVDADSLVKYCADYVGRIVETEGEITHVCSAGGKKLKFRTDGGETIRILPGECGESFADSLYQKRIRVKGVVDEKRIDERYIEAIERNRSLVCSIDHEPCLQVEWVEKQKAAGKADSLSLVDSQKLRERLGKSKKKYLSVVTIVAISYEVVGARGGGSASD
ncbi:MAG: hypothetical protein JW814_01860 [Candidatus Krumholzibacteriota bacterium]|nr:hypothetical protein [Candidatus Krumholzibacteriota bacterium]